MRLKGHPYQVTEEQKKEIRRLLGEGLRPFQVAESLGLSRSSVTKYSREELLDLTICPITGISLNLYAGNGA